MTFPKQAKTYVEQLQILKDRGLDILDEEFALHCLAHFNYYRLSAYRFPLTVKGDPDHFLPGAKFSDLWNLYLFDRALRRLVMDACKIVEISVRSRWAYVLGHKYGSQAYEDPSIFVDPNKFNDNLRKLDEELERSKEDFVKHFREKYRMPHPPIWAVCEVLSFGQVSRFCKSLNDPGDRQEIANTYGLDEKILTSFLHHLTLVRNLAAHHGRLWNRKMVVKFRIPQNRPSGLGVNFQNSTQEEFGIERRIYNTLVMLLYLVKIIEPQSN